MPVSAAAWLPDAPQAIVDLDALRANLALLRARTAPGVALMAAVKADAYGHGLLPVARALAAAGVEAFGVATATEALALRADGLPQEVLVFAPLREGIAELVAHDVALTVAHPGDLRAIETARAQAPARVHVKVDTGMGRVGVAPHDAPALVAAVARAPHAGLEGVWTHLASADEPDVAVAGGTTDRQLEAFAELLARLARDGLRPRWAHAANSAGLLERPEGHHDLVRPGIALYGQAPSPWIGARHPGLRPVLRLDAPVTFVKRVPAGTPISYGGTWTAPRDTVVATLRMGYADGYPRALSSRAEAAHRGRRVPVVGRVCMDQLMIDLGPEGAAEVGERVELLGGAAPSAASLADAAGSFVYELLTGIGPRVVRRYRGA